MASITQAQGRVNGEEDDDFVISVNRRNSLREIDNKHYDKSTILNVSLIQFKPFISFNPQSSVDKSSDSMASLIEPHRTSGFCV